MQALFKMARTWPEFQAEIARDGLSASAVASYEAERLIADVTHGPRIHVEVRFADGRCFSSRAPEGVSFLPSIDTSDAHRWEVIDLPWAESDNALLWCSHQIGMGYDWMGAMNSGLGLAWDNSELWFCSEIVAEVIRQCGGVDAPRQACPEDLHAWLLARKVGARQPDLAMAASQRRRRFNLFRRDATCAE